MMEKVIEKLEQYNILNNLIPGTIFTLLLKYYVGVNIIQNNAIENLIIYYFVGSIISRIGSLCIEPIYRGLKIIEKRDYEQYINARKKDSFIETLSEDNNMYRTLCSTFITIIIAKVIKLCILKYDIPIEITKAILMVIIVIIYTLAYRKQTNYIVKRIDKSNK